MKNYSLTERVNFYKQAFPNWPPPRTDKHWLDGIWMLGNTYSGKSHYYGTYPNGYLKRIMSLFPDAINILHLFSGALSKTLSIRDKRLDLQNAEIIGDAHKLSSLVGKERFDLILADPPYSNEDALHYGTPMIRRSQVIKECAKVLEPGGFLIWLDQVMPMYSKKKDRLHFCGAIGIVISTNHRFRIACIFQKQLEILN